MFYKKYYPHTASARKEFLKTNKNAVNARIINHKKQLTTFNEVMDKAFSSRFIGSKKSKSLTTRDSKICNKQKTVEFFPVAIISCFFKSTVTFIKKTLKHKNLLQAEKLAVDLQQEATVESFESLIASSKGSFKKPSTLAQSSEQPIRANGPLGYIGMVCIFSFFICFVFALLGTYYTAETEHVKQQVEVAQLALRKAQLNTQEVQGAFFSSKNFWQTLQSSAFKKVLAKDIPVVVISPQENNIASSVKSP